MRELERNLENALASQFEVQDRVVKVRTFLDEDLAQIFVDGVLVAEYGYGGAGCTFISHVDPRILIDIIAEIAHSGISKIRG
jgi:hypothetical protein